MEGKGGEEGREGKGKERKGRNGRIMENGDASTRAGPKDGRITLDERTEIRGSN